MEPGKYSIRIGAVTILLAVLLRLLSNAGQRPLLGAAGAKAWISRMFYLETGRYPEERPAPVPPRETQAPATLAAVPEDPEPPRKPPVFSREDLNLVRMRYDGAYRPDLEKLLLSPLALSLKSGDPAVLLVHTHGCESFDDVAPRVWRSPDPEKNMIAVGNVVEERLMAAGISVIHDRELHDYPSYNGSYLNSREAVARYLEKYPTISLVLDLHRDAADVPGGQLDTSVSVSGRESAQIMVVVGTDEGGLTHPEWEKNLALGLKLSAQLEKQTPGITRYVSLRTERFNHDLGEQALLIEIGAAGNTLAEAKLAADCLAQALLALSSGANLS